jgi:hypothetical protein
MANIRNDDPATGRLVQTRLTNEYDGPPQFFAIDDFFVVRGSDRRLHAWYVYPPGFFGHVRGCKLVWDQTATIATNDGGTAGPGLFVDPCGGARFDTDGELVSGPADRNLDEFPTSAAVAGMLVDTRELYCGSPLPTDATPESTPTARASAERCDRVSRDAP